MAAIERARFYQVVGVPGGYLSREEAWHAAARRDLEDALRSMSGSDDGAFSAAGLAKVVVSASKDARQTLIAALQAVDNVPAEKDVPDAK